MWSYEEPLPEARHIGGYVAFYPDQIEAWFEDEIEVEHPSRESAKAFTNPLLGWLLREAPDIATSRELTGELARCMRGVGIPLSRLFVVIRTLHPQLAAFSYRWWARSGEVEALQTPYEQLETPAYLNSPLKPIFDGVGGIRRRLDAADAMLDFGILRELHAEGATDYVAMPMTFSDGQINAITLTSDVPGGFDTTHLGHVYEVLGVLGRIYEVHALRRKAATLLDTYVGPHAGARVLDGHIKRGDGESIEAVIWFCDLRDSTPLARSMSRDAFLGCLNEYFDCLAGAVIDHGGQVLRFIGDAALAIFPIEDRQVGASASAAHEQALAALDDADRRMEQTNAERRQRGEPELAYGVALHVGEVTYGNIGTRSRLEFTVIGDAANRAARIEGLCKTLGEPALLSHTFAAAYPGRFVTLGRHSLRGVDEALELFAPRPAAAR
jgi:adenylate cyclase